MIEKLRQQIADLERLRDEIVDPLDITDVNRLQYCFDQITGYLQRELKERESELVNPDAAPPADRKTHLCATCQLYNKFPECLPADDDLVEFGDGLGNDNIINCINFERMP